ncbi:MAG: hypothetical protein ACHQWU_11805 [Gemmatimonadales bacterium]|jgi:hypothetical protein
MIDTFSSFVAGYTVAASLLAIYVITLWRRGRRASEHLAEARRRMRDADGPARGG